VRRLGCPGYPQPQPGDSSAVPPSPRPRPHSNANVNGTTSTSRRAVFFGESLSRALGVCPSRPSCASSLLALACAVRDRRLAQAPRCFAGPISASVFDEGRRPAVYDSRTMCTSQPAPLRRTLFHRQASYGTTGPPRREGISETPLSVWIAAPPARPCPAMPRIGWERSLLAPSTAVLLVVVGLALLGGTLEAGAAPLGASAQVVAA